MLKFGMPNAFITAAGFEYFGSTLGGVVVFPEEVLSGVRKQVADGVRL